MKSIDWKCAGGGLVAAALLLAGCGGGGSGSSYSAPIATSNPTSSPSTAPSAGPSTAPSVAPSGAPVTTQQVISMALPSSTIGTQTDPTYGLIGGYTQTLYSQTLAFAPGSQVMIRNGQTSTQHTFNVVSQSGFTSNPNLSLFPAGGSTIGPNFSTGTVGSGSTFGPFTLTAGLYFIGCAYHYSSNSMRTVLNVASGANPGAQATPQPNTTPPVTGGYYL